MICDCHCHAGQGDGLTGPWDTDAPIEPYLTRAAACGIQHTLVFAAFSSDYEEANREVADIVSRAGGRLSGLAFVHPARDRGRVLEIVRPLVLSHGFLGIKVHRHDARITREVCEAARALGVPVLYDVAGEVETIELLATQYPDVSFVIPHLSSFADEWRAQLAFIDHLVRHPNVHADTSGVRRFDLLEQAVARAGARKLLFGSDGPWTHPAVELAKVAALGLSPRDEQLVLAGNFMRIFVQPARARRTFWLGEGGDPARSGQMRLG